MFRQIISVIAGIIGFVASGFNPAVGFQVYSLTNTALSSAEALSNGANPFKVLGAIAIAVTLNILVPQVDSGNLFIQVAGNALRGAAIGAATAAAIGQDVGQGALWGGAFGAVTGFLGSQQMQNYRAGNGFVNNAQARHIDNMRASLGISKADGSLTPSQQSIDYVVDKYGIDTDNMLGQRPFYNKYQTWEGATDRSTRLVTIGPPAFKSEGLLASTIGHEGVHATQWSTPNWARSMGWPMREMQATQWMLDNATRLYNTPQEIGFFRGYYHDWESRFFDPQYNKQ